MIDTGCHKLSAIGAPCECLYQARVFERMDYMPIANIPQPYRLIITCGCNERAIGTPGHPRNNVGMSTQFMQHPLAGNIPDQRYMITAASNNRGSIWIPGD